MLIPVNIDEFTIHVLLIFSRNPWFDIPCRVLFLQVTHTGSHDAFVG